jgi:hypothetical protein
MEKPEQQAHTMDEKLRQAGWIVQKREHIPRCRAWHSDPCIFSPLGTSHATRTLPISAALPQRKKSTASHL